MSLSAIRAEDVSDPVDGVKDRLATRMELLTKLRDVHLDKVRAVIMRIVVASPTLTEEKFFGDDIARVFEERDEQAELNRGERELPFSSPGLVAVNVNTKVTRTELGLRH
jgi:hypothetical protein